MTTAHDNLKFSTKDQNNDNVGRNLALDYEGAWWYGKTHSANLNGLNLKGKHDDRYKGINWYSWKGEKESLVWTEIKVRPRNFKQISRN